MKIMSVREFNANTSAALSQVAAGEVITLTKHGRRFARIQPEPEAWLDDPIRSAAYERLKAGLSRPVAGVSGKASYDERTGR